MVYTCRGDEGAYNAPCLVEIDRVGTFVGYPVEGQVIGNNNKALVIAEDDHPTIQKPIRAAMPLQTAVSFYSLPDILYTAFITRLDR